MTHRFLSIGAVRRARRGCAAAAVALGLAAAPVAAEEAAFRVCADPNNLPFSNDKGEGFENKLAELVAGELGERVAYTWWAQRRGFVRNTLNAGLCDVVMGVPARFELVERTRPYYRSTYVFVYRSDRGLDLASIKDARLAALKVGVQLVGDNGFNTPPAQVLGMRGIVDNVVGFPVYGDYAEPNPPARIIDAVARGDVDVAAAWGPLAGYFAQRAPVPLAVVPIADTAEFRPLQFAYDISMGVRRGDRALHRRLDAVINRKGAEITALLEGFGVPLVDPPYLVHEAAQRDAPPTGR